MLNLKAGRTIVSTVVGEGGTKLSSDHPTLVRLVGALRKSGDPLVRFELHPHRDAHFRLRLKVKIDPAHQREMVLVAVEGMSYAEAATVLGIPAGTLMSRIARAREELRAELERASGRRKLRAVE